MLEAIFEMSCLSLLIGDGRRRQQNKCIKISRGKSSNSNGDVESTKLVQEVQEKKNQNFFCIFFLRLQIILSGIKQSNQLI